MFQIISCTLIKSIIDWDSADLYNGVRMHAFLSDFHVIRPKYEATQEEILEWVALSHAQGEARREKASVEPRFLNETRTRLLKLGMGPGKIQKRGSHLGDIFEKGHEMREIYNLSESSRGHGLKERSRFFEVSVNQLFEQFYPEGCNAPSHLIHVTCTGYVSPSGAQHLISKRGFGKKSCVTHAYHMGCYASIPAIRIAHGFLQKNNSVDLVHTELCSIHMNPLLHETEQLVVQSLFADGFIKYTLSPKRGVFKISALQEEILPDTTSFMSWRLEEWGFRMTIAKEVPVLIARALPSFVERLGKAKAPLFAIHPGGPKIIEQIQKTLKLSDEQVRHSQEVLRTCGNMSSATLPHVWEKMARDPEVKPGTSIISLAFGPGLTACGALFEKTEGY